MSNDPKDTVIDLSKLMISPSDGTSPQATPQRSTPSMITSLLEGAGANLKGHEHFTCDEKNTNQTD